MINYNSTTRVAANPGKPFITPPTPDIKHDKTRNTPSYVLNHCIVNNLLII